MNIKWYGGYDFTLIYFYKCQVEIILTSFLPFIRVRLLKEYLMQSDQALKYFLVFIKNILWVSKFGCSQKVSQTGKWVFGVFVSA